MVLVMARPTTRLGSRNAQFQKRVPADVLKIARGRRVALSLPPEIVGGEAIRMTITLGTTLRFSLRTDDKALRDMRHAAVVQQLETAFAAILAGPRRISLKECYELAGILYRDLNAGFEDDPIDAGWWRVVGEIVQDALTGLPWPPPDLDNSTQDRRLRALERYVGPFLDAILLREGVNADPEDRPQLLRVFAERITDAAKKLKRNAEGDFAPDPLAAKIPQWRGNAVQDTAKSSSLTFDRLLALWETNKAPTSIVAYRAAVANFSQHLGHNQPMRVTKPDVRQWRDALLAGDRTPKTVNDSYLAHIRTLYRLGMREDLLDFDPVEGVRAQETKVAGKGGRVYTDEEVAALLALADKEDDAKFHWMPWLLALTGARVGEIAQLWGEHVKNTRGIDYISITTTKDGGRLKNINSERDVPIHPALIERGFLKFVKKKGSGPLFYGGEAGSPRQRKSGQIRHASKGVANRLREWIRDNGFTDPRKAPCHAFRHWFKSICPEYGVLDSQANALQGHAGSDGEASRYRHARLPALYAAISKIPVPTTPPHKAEDDASTGGQS
ncbi:hypothetical protein [Hyphomicrobium sp.]|mgnify:CR=1 FL=1|uniref:hypothetical protein n=1 Tax=Hyphomicrobium sp. TaxID=82 RepID=UPI002FDE415D